MGKRRQREDFFPGIQTIGISGSISAIGVFFELVRDSNFRFNSRMGSSTLPSFLLRYRDPLRIIPGDAFGDGHKEIAGLSRAAGRNGTGRGGELPVMIGTLFNAAKFSCFARVGFQRSPTSSSQ